ncbi:Rhamnogalacturonan endolyase YesW precursor [Stieleria varia]|uniref:Rhamnogalacturonan endolyase YesW n=2 Tax=Stieleria varia TaxID=2528005 RepID=A0A5C5ZVD0_9BACT|nr:Rhamnogalacturonan endolyase YesW precursor [Stieleria varia]
MLDTHHSFRMSRLLTCFFACLLIGQDSASAQRCMEALDRGVVALNCGDEGVFLSWRLLGTEPRDVGFDVFRQSGDSPLVKLNEQPIAGATQFRDLHADLTHPTRYWVQTVGAAAGPGDVVELPASPPEQRYLSVPLRPPEGYYAGDASVGDLDGDGAYELVVHMTGRGRDNSQSGMTSQPILHAYKLDGTLLWSIDLGRNIREGAHYTQFMVYDLDCDGKAEVVCKTGDGTVDGIGKVIGDADADHRSQPRQTGSPFSRRRGSGPREGYVLKGPEYLTVFSGQTGEALATVPYVPRRHPETDDPTPGQLKDVWGDDYGNRVDRFLACVAYLDGERPSVIMSRGYYTRTVLAAWDWRDGKLQQRWVFDSNDHDASLKFAGQGNHSISVADVDDDGRDEIIFGSLVIDDDGSPLYSTGLGHGDAQHTSDIDPERPGLETWSIHEKPGSDDPGIELRNTRTGEIYFSDAQGRDVGRGMMADIDPRFPGAEFWGGTRSLLSARGERIGPTPRSQNMAIWWDGDLLRELLDGVSIIKWDHASGVEQRVFDGRSFGLSSNNGSKSNPCLCADILGDWREELIARTSDSRQLRIYVSTIDTQHRMVTLMHDPQYRLGIAWQNVGYNQPAHPSFFLGHGMKPQPNTPIRTPE